ncbi:MAG: Uma2 family endonuclease [Bacteroidota bacterium]
MDTIVLKDRITGSMSDEEFLWFCQENKDLRIERNKNLEIIIMSPTNSFSGKINTEVLRQLSNWNHQSRLGEVFDSSTGFSLPDRSIFSPDAAWMPKAKWNQLTDEQKNSFAPVCPDFVIEIRSKSDYIEDVVAKMENWMNNGAVQGWIIDPIDEKVYLFHQDGRKEMVEGFGKSIKASHPVQGFELDLSLLKI